MYISEAHANDEWKLPDAQGTPDVRQPRSTEERRDLAECFKSTFAENGADLGPLVVDTATDEAMTKYAAWPERLYIVVDDVIVYKSGPGPFGYVLDDVKSWLEVKFGKR